MGGAWAELGFGGHGDGEKKGEKDISGLSVSQPVIYRASALSPPGTVLGRIGDMTPGIPRTHKGSPIAQASQGAVAVGEAVVV